MLRALDCSDSWKRLLLCTHRSCTGHRSVGPQWLHWFCSQTMKNMFTFFWAKRFQFSQNIVSLGLAMGFKVENVRLRIWFFLFLLFVVLVWGGGS